MKKWIGLAIFLIAFQMMGASVPSSQESIVERGLEWMDGHPIMGNASRSVTSVETLTGPNGYKIYVVQLSPNGYLVLNSDERLPLVAAFSAGSTVDLTDTPQNTFRAMLERHVVCMENALANPASLPPLPTGGFNVVTELYGPFMDTTWNQCNPYNLLCPADPSASDYYGQRTPTGCVPTAYAQIMFYHRWPLYGEGSNSYTDSEGSITGPHSADFSDTYDWQSMLTAYDAWSTNGVAEENAISELMYELGVAAEANYDTNGTFSSTPTLGNRMSEYFFFEAVSNHTTQVALITPLEADLRAGWPCVVSIPGHSVVADGLMVDDGTTTYHINYGWGGTNNGWWTKDGIPGGALNSGTTSLRPRLMAFPQTNSVSASAGGSVDLNWIIPKRRETEMTQLNINSLEKQTGNWQTDASTITASANVNWTVTNGYSGDGWYSGSGPSLSASMTLDEVFVPDASANLTFWLDHLLVGDEFTISVSTNNGVSYSQIFTEGSRNYRTWTSESVSLSAYAGQQIRIRFAADITGSYYPGGGVWIDELAVTSGDWYDWELFTSDTTLNSERYSATTNAWDDCDDFSIFEVTSTDSYKDWVVSTTSGVANCFYKQPGGYGDREYHLTSYSTITPTTNTCLLINAKYNLADDIFRVLVSTDRSSFTEVWSVSSQADWSDISIDLSAYAGQAIYVRLEYVVDSYYTDGGIWVDSVKTMEVTHPELEGQPIYTTTLTNLTAGTYTLAASLIDTNAVEQSLAPSFTLNVAGVDDGDGMPAAWEEQYGLDPEVDDGGLDPDSDGYSNYEEYVCNTVPTNGASCWLLGPGDGDLPSFDAYTGRLYTIEYKDDLVSGSWTSLASDIPGSNTVIEVQNYDAATNAARFYRVYINLE